MIKNQGFEITYTNSVEDIQKRLRKTKLGSYQNYLCSPDPTTNSEILNPEFSQMFNPSIRDRVHRNENFLEINQV